MIGSALAGAGHAAGGGPAAGASVLQPQSDSQAAPKRSRDINALTAVAPAKGQRASVEFNAAPSTSSPAASAEAGRSANDGCAPHSPFVYCLISSTMTPEQAASL
jgi:hypothetical protein